MGNKFLKWLIPLSLGAVLMSTGVYYGTNVSVSAYEYTTPAVTLGASRTVAINNPAFREYLKNTFNKTNNDSFKSDEFLNSSLFNNELRPEDQIFQIDLSNTGIKDIRELAQFELPENISAINLSENGITNDDLNYLSQLLELEKDQEFHIGDKNIIVGTDFKTQITRVNLNGNNIDLKSTPQQYLDDERLLFGFQNLDEINSISLVMKGEINPCYYIRENIDENYISYTIKNNLSTNIDSRIPIIKNQVVEFLSGDSLNDGYQISAKVIPGTASALFSGYTYEKEFIQFEVGLKPDFAVERKHLLDLSVSSAGVILENSPIVLKGFGDNSGVKVSYDNVSTTRLTDSEFKNYVNITINYNGAERVIPIEFKVVDTIKPVIKLRGSAHALSSQGKDYIDPGVIAYDPSNIGDETGDDITSMVITSSNLNVTTLGQYTITYTVTDLAGNTSSITRIVEIQPRVLDEITVRVNEDKIKVGDDIVLVVQPDQNIPLDNYRDIKYDWYLNGVKFLTSYGDSVSGKSSITIVAEESISQQVYVKVTAVQKSNGIKIELYSNTLTLSIDPSLRSDNSLIIAIAIVVLLIILTITIVTIVKYSKAKAKTHKKRKSTKKGGKSKKAVVEEKPKGPEIQVIKDYGVSKPAGSTGNSEGGGNVNTRPPETQEKDNM